MTACAVPACDQPAASRRPVCSPHWRFVPLSLQGAYWRKQPDTFTRTFIDQQVVEAAAREVPQP